MENGPEPATLHRLQEQAKAALSHWNLQDQIPVLLKYRENAVFRIRLHDGKPAALRLHRPGYHNEQALTSELLWMAALHAGRISVPQIIPAANGQPLVRLTSNDHPQEQFADIISWIDGTPLGASGVPFTMTPDALETVFTRIGQTMAEMHTITDLWPVAVDFQRPRWDLEGLVGDKPLWGRFWDCRGLSSEDRRDLAAIRCALQDALASKAYQELDFGLIHADLVRENIMINGPDIAFIDFDDCGFGFRMFELATALLKNRKEPHFDLIQHALIEGYRSRRSLSDEALETLPLFLLIRSLTYIGWSAARLDEPGMAARLQRSIAESKDLFQQFRRI